MTVVNRACASRFHRAAHRRLAIAVLALVATVAAAFAGGEADAAVDAAATYVQKSASEAISILSNPSLADSDKRTQFRSVILKSFDVPAIGRFVTSPYWDKATPEQRAEFQAVFQGALANIYTERFFDYDGQSLQVQQTLPAKDGVTIVKTTITTPTSGKTYDVDWYVAGGAGKEKFLDVVIDGVSTSVTTQQDYGSVLQSSNGNLGTLTAALKAKGQY